MGQVQNIVPNDSRYIPLTQQKWCCVPTCIQMVMLRLHIPLQSAELIGYHMGLVVPEKARQLFWNSQVGPKPPAGYGTQIGKFQYGPNAAFKKLRIPLKMTWALINKFDSLDLFRNYLSDFEKSDKDVFICYDWPSLFDPKNKEHWGHVCVLDQVYLNNDVVRFVDPGQDEPKWRSVKIDKLYKSMKFHGEKNSAGFWELTKVG